MSCNLSRCSKETWKNSGFDVIGTHVSQILGGRQLTTELRSHTLGLGHTLESSSFPWRNLIINFDEINFIHLLLLCNALLCLHKAVVQLGDTHYSVWEWRFITDIRWCLVPLSKISVTAYHESPIVKRLEPPKYLAKDRRLDSYWEHLGVLFLRVYLFHSLNNIFCS